MLVWLSVAQFSFQKRCCYSNEPCPRDCVVAPRLSDLDQALPEPRALCLLVLDEGKSFSPASHKLVSNKTLFATVCHWHVPLRALWDNVYFLLPSYRRHARGLWRLKLSARRSALRHSSSKRGTHVGVQSVALRSQSAQDLQLTIHACEFEFSSLVGITRLILTSASFINDKNANTPET